MIWFLLALHVVTVVVLSITGARLGRNALLVAAVPMAVTAVWSATRLGTNDAIFAGFQWVPGLDVAIEFRVDAMGSLLSLLVSGIATLRVLGLAPNFSVTWMASWLSSWLVAFPAVLVVAPFVRRIVHRLVRPD